MLCIYHATSEAARKRLKDTRARLLILIADERDKTNSDSRRIQRWLSQINTINEQLNQHPG